MGFHTSVWKPCLFWGTFFFWGAAPIPAKPFLERKGLDPKELDIWFQVFWRGFGGPFFSKKGSDKKTRLSRKDDRAT